ncbi:hypothetical protein [Luteimonas sp. MC1572]|uniref:hypothetical protein n=1 Tax=Luteimonas sp. MC1572 TaxID=2799325 RepID=UPI0018F0DF20|nr:hypothetical protein [Luteimonas sp. MC1572]MBJ6981997.1 hypothetical protein [Luteimonas sp. MC1572]QQO03296.1 hypothetical protein JGR64_00480 [Luteimonas sp. MC1572]
MTRKLAYAAYPTLGEALRFVIAAFDLRVRAEPGHVKRLDRMATVGDFDSELFNKLVEALVEKRLSDLGDPTLGVFLAEFIRGYRMNYAKLLGKVSADALERGQLMPLLIQGYFPRCVADFMLEASNAGFIPAPELLLAEPLAIGPGAPRVSPLRVVLEEHLWRQGASNPDVLAAFQRTAEPGSREPDKARDWLSGKHVPDMGQLLLSVSRSLGKRSSSGGHDLPLYLVRAIRIARALEYILAAVPPGVDFATEIRRLLPLGAPEFDFGTAVHGAIVQQATEWEQLSELGLGTFARLAFDHPWDESARTHATELLPLFEQRAASAAAPWATEWMVRWCRARLAIWQGRWEDGLEWYDQAFKAAVYRAGPESGRLLREALGIAATMKKKAAINRYVEQANALNLWPPVLRGMEITSDDGEFLSEILTRAYLPYLPQRTEAPTAA